MIEVSERTRIPLLNVTCTVIIFTVAVSLSACGEKALPPTKAHPVLVTTTRNISSKYDRTFTATVQARYESDQGFRTSGKVIARNVEVGQTVSAGQTLACLDPVDYELELRAAENQLQAARVDSAQAASDEARLRRLLAAHSVSVADHERQKARADAAAARQEQASRQLDLARNRTKYTTLVAEFDGVVTSIRFEIGQVVTEGMPIITVAKQTELEVVADLPEEMAGRVDSMTALAIMGNSPNRSIPLKLREMSPVASTQTRTYRARFTVLDKSPVTQQTLHLGMTANLHLTQKNGQLATVLPAVAVWNTDGQSMVWIVDGTKNQLAAQPVDIIRYTNEAVLVLGLTDGTRVVSAGIQKLTSGLDVVPIERSASGMNLEIPTTQESALGRQQ